MNSLRVLAACLHRKGNHALVRHGWRIGPLDGQLQLHLHNRRGRCQDNGIAREGGASRLTGMELSYRRYWFPPVVIQHAVWLYLRFTLSYRDVEDLLAERGLDIS